jgi:hypothetical protein
MARRIGIQVPSGIFQHNHWSGKDCPMILRHRKNGWQKFLDQVTAHHRDLEDVETPAIGPFAGGQDDHQD